MKLSFSLKAKSTNPTPVTQAPSLSRPVGFGDEDEKLDAAPTAFENSQVGSNKGLIAQNVKVSKAMKKRMEEEQSVDETVYDYDGVWDKIQEAKLRQKEAKESDSKERKPKYISGLLNSAATRKLDYVRAEEKMIQREREMEGDEFADKDAFVTQAYKDQMAEVRRAEEEEKKREELEKKRSQSTSKGMAPFYRLLLEESEKKHEEAVAATHKPKIGPQPNLTIVKPLNFVPKSDLDLAKEAREQGKEVELNDDNQIVDKRDLLSAGLNLSAPNTRHLGLHKRGQTQPQTNEPVQTHRAVGTAATRKEIQERREREIRQQMEDETRRLAKEDETRDEEAHRRIVAKRNNEDSVLNARERFLERKRRKLEESRVVVHMETL